MTSKLFTQPRRVRVRPKIKREGECPICSTFTCLERHHWFESGGSQWEVCICGSCNRALSSNCSIALGDHLLPPWEVQVEYVRRVQARQVEPCQPPPPTLSQCKKDLELFRSWLGRSHTEREIRSFEFSGMSEEEVVEMVKKHVEYLEGRVKSNA